MAGGHGDPLLLLGGRPRTWWRFHKIVPALAKRFQGVAVDLRGRVGDVHALEPKAADLRVIEERPEQVTRPLTGFFS
ncbi:hypothetical protein GCM10009678_08020 [Actinomadura kijaniata]|uniref:Pimeloyl-ACP methyl ester carboxylesterase n=1 Tax=Actinomadura namibiensis TaxID=182080 RepID=A0A7W3QQ35_ACTNM|nr:hypothetical protein [Actinomadura namibiensis]MBA8955300.1 pimeloyl-ACP methyl ester carboxylesterase [Actinomadura namibiensis]